jgi:hypothetical protein
MNRRLVLATLGVWALVGTTAEAQAPETTPIEAGNVLVYEPSRPGNALERGDSNSEFGLRLPEGAECPGDSRNDGWRVQAFIVPIDKPMAEVEWTVIGATGPNQSLLFTSTQGLFVDELTVANAGPGQPGRIPDPPIFSFAIMKPGTLAPGEYRIGIACTNRRQLDRYWDATMVIAADPDVQPGQLQWRLPGAAEVAPVDGLEIDSTWLVRGAAIAAALGALGYLFFTRRSSSRRPSSPQLHEETLQ